MGTFRLVSQIGKRSHFWGWKGGGAKNSEGARGRRSYVETISSFRGEECFNSLTEPIVNPAELGLQTQGHAVAPKGVMATAKSSGKQGIAAKAQFARGRSEDWRRRVGVPK